MKTEKSTNSKYILFVVISLVIFAVIIVDLYRIQVIDASKYQTDAGNKSVKTLRITGKRGMITDSDSVVLAMSSEIYNVTFQQNMKQIRKEDYQKFTPSILETIKIIENYGGSLCVSFVIEREEKSGDWVFNFGQGVSERVTSIRKKQWYDNHYMSETDPQYDTAEKCFNELKTCYQMDDLDLDEATILKVMSVYSEMRMNLYNSVPIVIAKNIPFSAVSEITGRKMMLAGIDVETGEKRIYPRGNLASQVIGYVGPISESDKYNESLKPIGYSMSDIIGKDGVEKSMENWLTPNITSRQGTRIMERDNLGRLTRQISFTAPSDGNNVKLTLNASYQQAAEKAIADNIARTRIVQEKRMARGDWLEKNREKLEIRDFDKFPMKLADVGAMIVVDVNSCNVLAMAQYPTFDLNAMTAGGDEARQYLTDERKVLTNYCIQSRAEPGSIFKMVTALAAMTNNRLSVTDQISDEGGYTRYTRNEKEAPVCWIAKGQIYKHANQTIVEGIKNSCNYFFYELAGRLYGDSGSNLLYKYSAQLGLTTKTGIQLPGEARSIVGCQTSLYDPESELYQQETDTPILVAASIKKHLKNIGASYGISYDEERLDTCIRELMNMAIKKSSTQWSDEMRPILMRELNMTRDMVWKQAVIGDIWIYLNDIKWGGSMEVQLGIGQSITMLTPAAVSRYVASLGNGGVVYNLSIIDSIVSPEGEILNKYEPSVFGKLEGEPYLPYIREGMKGVVDADQAGTAGRYFKNWKYADEIWAKTGTSQITRGKVKLDVENNGWFVALAPFSTPAEIAVITLIPNGLSGGETTLAAQEFIAWWMDNRTKDTGTMPIVPGNELMP